MQTEHAPAQALETLDTPADFARVTNTTGQTVRNWINAGIVPVKVRIGRVIRLDRGEALAALAEYSNRRTAQ